MKEGESKRRSFAASLDAEEETGVQSGLLLSRRYCEERRATDSETIGVLPPAAHQRPPNSPSITETSALADWRRACDRLQHYRTTQRSGKRGRDSCCRATRGSAAMKVTLAAAVTLPLLRQEDTAHTPSLNLATMLRRSAPDAMRQRSLVSGHVI